MRKRLVGIPLGWTLVFLWASSRLWAAELPHHDLSLVVEPETGGLRGEDVLTLPVDFRGNQVRVDLHADLSLTSDDPNLEIREGDTESGPSGTSPVPLKHYDISWKQPLAGKRLRLSYSGVIQHDLEQEPEEYARSFSSTPGMISGKGIFLAGSSHWVPQTPDWGRLTFELLVDLPEPFDVVSQGRRSLHESKNGRRRVKWSEESPMEEIYLIGAPFHEYRREAGAVTAYAFLREADPNLAARYLEATAQYLEMYSRLIGVYPYAKFALVENFWETGYGMPSFTLLGPTVIRLPFILHTSYPHEILHNWWGNSVYVDYEEGNWCEGLTAYMADHLTKEAQGQGADYRRDTLENYRNFASESRDFALRDFRSRHSPSTEAVGYGKSLMLWHMLRLRLGDAGFIRALQELYRQYRFQETSFDDIRKIFSQSAGQDLAPFFDQWVNRVGAPELVLESARTQPSAGGYRLSLRVKQVQDGPAYQLRVPVSVTLRGEAEARRQVLEMSEKQSEGNFEFSEEPLLVRVDPEFGLFRKLDRREIPPSLSQLYGSRSVTLILPAGNAEEEAAWRALAESWRSPDSRHRIVREDELKALPDDSSVWILGLGNRWAGRLKPVLAEYQAGLEGDRIRFGEVTEPLADRSFVLAGSHPSNPQEAVAWVASTRVDAIAGLARKLPHYGKYSYLAFAGSEPANTVEGQWPTFSSPLVRRLSDEKGVEPGSLPARTPLARLEPVFSPEGLRAHIEVLTSKRFEGRGVGTAGIELAAQYLADQFRDMGLEPAGDQGSFFQTWEESGGPKGPVVLRNVVARLPGLNEEWKDQSVVLGAHYDHLGFGWPDARQGEEGHLHPGADDNASGVAVLLEVARLLAQQLKPQRSILFVAFSGEEWGLRGSRHFIQNDERWPTGQMLAAVNLDSVGRLEGREILVLGGGSASEWVHIARGIGFTTGIASKLVADDLGSSDQRSFLEAGVPAVQIFAGPHPDYHRPSDTADKIDLAGMIQVASFVREAIVYLSERDTRLTSTLDSTPVLVAAPPTGRRAALGTVPDFAYSGEGVRVESVLEGSAAQKAGILAGDILIRLAGVPIADLRAYATQLASHEPGEEVEVVVLRSGQQQVLRATLGRR